MKFTVSNIIQEILYQGWAQLSKYKFTYKNQDGTTEERSAEVFDRGDGAAIFLYDPHQKTVLLTRQFRLPTYVNGNADGLLLEVCAGMLDDLDPEEAIKKEIEEETGYRIDQVKKIGQMYTSPGAVTEILHLFTGIYSTKDRVSAGGGSAEEQEDIQVVEYAFAKAKQLLAKQEIYDAKTLVLLQYAQLNGLLE
ncbi:NUDIX domain-containing protein [Croceiramulus getboli]|nr:NUDIX domain-containing protein [Flavobacteriaceae bacterium YJPT1-3]